MNSLSHLWAPKYWVSWTGVFLIYLISWLPKSVRFWLASKVAKIAWKVNHKRREIVLTNLHLCFPENSDEENRIIGKTHFQKMTIGMFDLGQIWFRSENHFSKQVEIDGWEHIEQARSQGRNIILNVAHSPSLDFGGVAISMRASAIGPYKQAKNAVIDAMIFRGRTRFKGRVFKRSDGMLTYTRALKRGEILYTLSDEDYGLEHSVYAPLFTQTKATLPMVGRLAKLAGASVFPVTTWYNENRQRYTVSILPAIDGLPSGDPETDAILLNQSLEQLIELEPTEYMWTLKLFKTQPDGRNVYQK